MNAMRPGLPDPLIDLLGARWSMGAPVIGAAWIDGGAASAFGLADGTVAIARATWEGAARVQPRQGGGVEVVPASGAPPPVTRVGVHVGSCLHIVADGAGGALSGGADGRLAAIGADGLAETLASFPGTPIRRVAAGSGARACAVAQQAHRFGPDAGTLDLSAEVTALAFAPEAGSLAVGHAGGVMLWGGDVRLLAGPGTPRALAWSQDGRHLVAGLQEDAALAWHLPHGAQIALGGYALPPLSLSFSVAGGLFATSGGSRVVCWHLQGDAAQRTECGVGSAAAVTQVACHPVRPLIATGYENGAVLLCQPDSADLLFVRSAGGGAVTTLAWSPDGAHLALGTAGGEIGVVAFPDQMFRAAPAAHRSEAA